MSAVWINRGDKNDLDDSKEVGKCGNDSQK